MMVTLSRIWAGLLRRQSQRYKESYVGRLVDNLKLARL